MFGICCSAGHHGRVFHGEQGRGYQDTLASPSSPSSLALESEEGEHEASLAQLCFISQCHYFAYGMSGILGPGALSSAGPTHNSHCLGFLHTHNHSVGGGCIFIAVSRKSHFRQPFYDCLSDALSSLAVCAGLGRAPPSRLR